MIEKEHLIVDKIKNHILGKTDEAFSLYSSLCDLLKEKYGLVDKNYDENPTKRGNEWLDIHHILEYKLDDIANRTKNAIDIEKDIANKADDEIIITLTSNEFRDDKKIKDIKQNYPNRKIKILTLDYSLERLKPYNLREQLVYANKIEHFLLHYLIDSMRGKYILSGGPNFLWDCSVSLDLYGFEQAYMNKIQNKKDTYYSILSSEEVTLLYKKLIDWKEWDVEECERYWTNYKAIQRSMRKKGVSYIKDNEKFFKLLHLLDYKFTQTERQNILSLPYRAKIVPFKNSEVKEINYHFYSMDEKIILLFNRILDQKCLTVPNNVEKISDGAFYFGASLETITIPETVKEIDDDTFIKCKRKTTTRYCPKLKKIIYKGTKEMWNCNFSNVKLDGIKLQCKKTKINPTSKPIFTNEIIGEWKMGDNDNFFIIKKSDIEDEYLIEFNEYATTISVLSSHKFSFSYIDKTNNSTSTYYASYIQGTQTQGIVLTEGKELSNAIEEGDYIFCTRLNTDTSL